LSSFFLGLKALFLPNVLLAKAIPATPWGAYRKAAARVRPELWPDSTELGPCLLTLLADVQGIRTMSYRV